MDMKKLSLPVVALGLGISIGAGGAKIATAPIQVSAKATQLRMLADGQLALGIAVKIGAGQALREIVWGANGENPRLDGRSIDDVTATELGKSATVFNRTCADSMMKLADRLSQADAPKGGGK